MSRRKKGKPAKSRADRRAQKQAVNDVTAQVEEITENLTCSTAVTAELADRCEGMRVQTEYELLRARTALEMWTPVAAEDTKRVVELLQEFAEEQERHHQVLVRLRDQLEEYAARDIHEHLEPADQYADLVFRRLFQEPLDAEAKGAE